MKNKILHLLMASLFLLTTAIAKADITVYIYKGNLNAAPYVHAWNTSGDLLPAGKGGWPGQQVTTYKQVSGVDYYYVTITGTNPISMLIHDNKGKQTGNITDLTTDTYFNWDGNKTANVIIDPSNPNNTTEAPKPAEMTVYFNNSQVNFATPCCYYWGDNGASGEPGDQMVLVKNKIYSASIPVGSNVIFKGSDGWSNQSDNIEPAQANHLYTIGSSGGAVTDKGVYDPNEAEEKPKAPDQIYVIGQVAVGEWNPTKGYELTKSGSTNVYTGEVTLTGKQFSFCSKLSSTEGNWNDLGTRFQPADDIDITPGTQYDFPTSSLGDKCWNVADFTRAAKYNVTVDWDNLKFKVEFVEFTVAPELVLSGNLYIIGTLVEGGWTMEDPGTGLKMEGSNGKFTAKNVAIQTAYESALAFFRFADGVGADWGAQDGYNVFGAAAKDTPAKVGESNEITLYQANWSKVGDNGWSIEPGTYDFEVDITGAPDNMTFIVTPSVLKPEALYIIGSNINGKEVTTTGDENKMTEQDGIYSIELDQLGTDKFKITDGADYNFGSNGQKLTLNEPYTASTDSSADHIAIDNDGAYLTNANVKLDLAAGTVTVTGTTTIDVLGVETVVTVVDIFDLAGRAVATSVQEGVLNTLKPGVYVVRNGTEVKKLLVK